VKLQRRRVVVDENQLSLWSLKDIQIFVNPLPLSHTVVAVQTVIPGNTGTDLVKNRISVFAVPVREYEGVEQSGGELEEVVETRSLENEVLWIAESDAFDKWMAGEGRTVNERFIKIKDEGLGLVASRRWDKVGAWFEPEEFGK
jgi:hypothetical protein